MPSFVVAATFLTALVGCAKQSQDRFVAGQTTAAELRASLGEPTSAVVPNVRPQARLLEYPDGCRYQIERSLVVGIACPPAAGESTLQYWRHKWKGDRQVFEEIPESRDSHGHRKFRLLSPKANAAVIYEESSDRVVQVVSYGIR